MQFCHRTCFIADSDHVSNGLGLKSQLGLVERLAEFGHGRARLGPAPAPRVQYLPHDSATLLLGVTVLLCGECFYDFLVSAHIVLTG